MKGNLLSSLYEYYTLNFGYLMELFKHLLMSIYGVLFACIIGIPIGILIARYSKIAWPVITIANIIQTVPAIAMLAILMLALGSVHQQLYLQCFYIPCYRLLKHLHRYDRG